MGQFLAAEQQIDRPRTQRPRSGCAPPAELLPPRTLFDAVLSRREISVHDAEADRVRDIFRSYLKLGSLNLLMADLSNRGIVTKVRTLKTGQIIGGTSFTRGPLAYLLRNRFYVGKVVFKGETLAGEQPAIVARTCSMRSKPS